MHISFKCIIFLLYCIQPVVNLIHLAVIASREFLQKDYMVSRDYKNLATEKTIDIKISFCEPFLHTENDFLNTIKISQILQNQFIDFSLTEQFYKCHNIDFVT